MKEGFIPFFVWLEGYKPVFYYGKPSIKFSTVIKRLAKILKKKSNDLLNNSFYYDNKLIKLDSSLMELKIEPLSVIMGE